MTKKKKKKIQNMRVPAYLTLSLQGFKRHTLQYIYRAEERAHLPWASPLSFYYPQSPPSKLLNPKRRIIPTPAF